MFDIDRGPTGINSHVPVESTVDAWQESKLLGCLISVLRVPIEAIKAVAGILYSVVDGGKFASRSLKNLAVSVLGSCPILGAVGVTALHQRTVESMEKSEQFLPEISSRDSFDVLKKFFLSPPNQLTLSERVKAQLILREMQVDQFFSLYDQFGQNSDDRLIFYAIYRNIFVIFSGELTEQQKQQLFRIIGSSLQEDTGKEVPKTSEQEETGKERQTTLETQTSPSEIHTGTKAEENVNLPDSHGPEQPKNQEDSDLTHISSESEKEGLSTPKKNVTSEPDSDVDNDDVDDISKPKDDDASTQTQEDDSTFTDSAEKSTNTFADEAVKDDNPLGLTDDRVLDNQIEQLNRKAKILQKDHLKLSKDFQSYITSCGTKYNLSPTTDILKYKKTYTLSKKLPFSEILRFQEGFKEQTERLTDLMKRGCAIIDQEKDKYVEARIVPVREFSRLDQKLSFLNSIKENVETGTWIQLYCSILKLADQAKKVTCSGEETGSYLDYSLSQYFGLRAIMDYFSFGLSNNIPGDKKNYYDLITQLEHTFPFPQKDEESSRISLFEKILGLLEKALITQKEIKKFNGVMVVPNQEELGEFTVEFQNVQAQLNAWKKHLEKQSS